MHKYVNLANYSLFTKQLHVHPENQTCLINMAPHKQTLTAQAQCMSNLVQYAATLILNIYCIPPALTLILQ